MTPSEAIRRIAEHNRIHGKKEPQAILITEAMDMAVEALEKQTPYKPKEYEDKFYACKCGNCVLYKWEHYPDVLTPKEIEGLPYCLACGQRLEW